jgi:predicted acyl esterase
MGLRRLLIIMLLFTAFETAFQPGFLSAQEYIVKHARHWVTTWDGYKLDVDVYSPSNGGNFPLVIFSPSWSIGKIEYMIPATIMAKKGYVAVSYSARGRFKSTGIVNVGEENDMRDVSSIIDFVLANYPVNGEKIGMSGISMGGERSLTIPIYEKRIKAVAALSCTANYHENLYKQNTPNKAHAFTGEPTIFADAINNLINGSDISDTIRWMEFLSPATHLDDYNSLTRPPSIYISNAYDDSLMDNNSLLEFFKDLDFPEKVIDLNDGKHAFPVGIGCVGLPERTWTKVYKWFDYYLKGIPSDIIERVQKTKIGFQIKGSGERLYFDSWPPKEIWHQNLYLHPRKDCPTNSDSMKSGMNVFPYKSDAVDMIYSGTGSAANLGPYDDLSEINLSPVTANIDKLNGRYALVYETIPFCLETIVAGIPKLSLSVTPSMPDAQIIAYVYDVDKDGKGTLLTHSAWTLRDAKPEKRVRLNFDFTALACRIPKSHKLALVLDTYDPRFGFPERPAYTVGISYDDRPTLKMPYTYLQPVQEPVK